MTGQSRQKQRWSSVFLNHPNPTKLSLKELSLLEHTWLQALTVCNYSDGLWQTLVFSSYHEKKMLACFYGPPGQGMNSLWYHILNHWLRKVHHESQWAQTRFQGYLVSTFFWHLPGPEHKIVNISFNRTTKECHAMVAGMNRSHLTKTCEILNLGPLPNFILTFPITTDTMNNYTITMFNSLYSTY